MHSDTKLTATDATDAKTPANSTSPRRESNGRRPRPGFGQKSAKRKVELDFAYPSNPGTQVLVHFLAAGVCVATRTIYSSADHVSSRPEKNCFVFLTTF